MESLHFITIREAAKHGPLSEYALRMLRARGELPGVQVGNRFLVNYELLVEKLSRNEIAGG